MRAPPAAAPVPTRQQRDPHFVYPIPEKGFRALRVIYNETLDPVIVVTVFFDEEVTDL